MRICIDMLTPKQVLFFDKVKEKLEKKNHNVILTTRKYREAEQLLTMRGLKAEVIGRHGGGDVYSKLIESAKRTIELAEYIRKIRPDVCLSFSSPEMARVSFGLKIPHVTVNDSPHSIFVAKLTIPLSVILCTPQILMEDWLKLGLGLTKDRVITYNALDCIAWLKDFKPTRSVIEELGLTLDKPIVTIRSVERAASYVSGEKLDVIRLVKIIKKRYPKFQFVVLPRYEETEHLRAVLPEEVIVPERVVDATSLLSFTYLFIGGGGTMTTEACLMGVPSINFFPNQTRILNFLKERGLLWRAVNLEEVLKLFEKIAKNYDEIKRRLKTVSSNIVEGMEDPTDVIVETLMKINNFY